MIKPGMGRFEREHPEYTPRSVHRSEMRNTRADEAWLPDAEDLAGIP